MQQHRYGDQALLVDAVEHDGTSLSDALIVTVEDLGLAAVFNVKNEDDKQEHAPLPLSPTQRSGADGRIGDFDAVKHGAVHCANRSMHAAGNSAVSRVGSGEGGSTPAANAPCHCNA